ncbi:MAG: type IV secretion system DNA-binding domain-containing protein [Halolamina sp.]|uniref:type IV secretory system conjugative DNA transfer family protein n=1 Tax=Halolamina sp. TaxID=1940283 RepID=UPI002FC2C193
MPDDEQHIDSYLLPFKRRTSGGKLRAAEPDRDRSIHVLGETGSGKTEAIKLMAYQFSVSEATPFVVFDYKGDYREFFDEWNLGIDVISLSLDTTGENWNIFNEVHPDGNTAEEFEEIGRLLFKKYEEQSNNPYFPQAARQVFVAILKMIWQNMDHPDNHDLVATFRETTEATENTDKPTEIHQLLRKLGFISEAAHLNPDAKKQTAGVYGNLQMAIGELFRGSFAQGGEFSIRDYMTDPDGRVLLLDFPLDRGETVKPIYRFFIDWAIRYGLQQQGTAAYFLLDEFQTIPGLEKIERLVNAGRARKAYAILGLQSVAQLEASYGEADAQSILSGLAQEVLLRPGDETSTNYIRSRLGQEFVKQDVAEPDKMTQRDAEGEIIEDPTVQTLTREEYPISEAELQQFEPGEAIIIEQDDWHHEKLHVLQTIFEDPVLDVLENELTRRHESR